MREMWCEFEQDFVKFNATMPSMLWSTTAASLIGLAYVGGLYVWRSDLDRDHPETIKRRFLSAFFTSCLCPPLVYVFGDPGLLSKHRLYEVIGIRTPGLLAACTLPLGLTMVLFLGPLAMLVSNDRVRWLMHPHYWSKCFSDWIWWRNHVVAPFTEEFAFRWALWSKNDVFKFEIQAFQAKLELKVNLFRAPKALFKLEKHEFLLDKLEFWT